MSAAPKADDGLCFEVDEMSPDGVQNATKNNPRLLGLPIALHVVLGGARLSFRELMELSPSSVLRLDKKVNDPVEIAIGEHVFARGVLVEDGSGDNGLSVKIIEVIDDEA